MMRIHRTEYEVAPTEISVCPEILKISTTYNSVKETIFKNSDIFAKNY